MLTAWESVVTVGIVALHCFDDLDEVFRKRTKYYCCLKLTRLDYFSGYSSNIVKYTSTRYQIRSHCIRFAFDITTEWRKPSSLYITFFGKSLVWWSIISRSHPRERSYELWTDVTRINYKRMKRWHRTTRNILEQLYRDLNSKLGTLHGRDEGKGGLQRY